MKWSCKTHQNYFFIRLLFLACFSCSWRILTRIQKEGRFIVESGLYAFIVCLSCIFFAIFLLIDLSLFVFCMIELYMDGYGDSTFYGHTG